MSLINDSSTPYEVPQNDWTAMIDAVRRRNAAGGALPPELGVPVTGTPMPSVRSAAIGKPVEAPPQLSVSEIEELNRQAIASGMVKGPVNPGIAQTLGDDSPYGSLEDAIRAGAPVGADDEAVNAGAAQFREAQPVFPGPVLPVRPVGGRQTAREFIAAQSATQLPRLPDFKKVQMIDCVNGKVYVDGLEFEMLPEELKMMRKFAVTKAKEQIQKALEEALSALSEDADGEGSDEAV